MVWSVGVIHHRTREELRDSESNTAIVRIFTKPIPAVDVNILPCGLLATNCLYWRCLATLDVLHTWLPSLIQYNGHGSTQRTTIFFKTNPLAEPNPSRFVPAPNYCKNFKRGRAVRTGNWLVIRSHNKIEGVIKRGQVGQGQGRKLRGKWLHNDHYNSHTSWCLSACNYSTSVACSRMEMFMKDCFTCIWIDLVK